ncbi:MAG TPA: hypothetical protein DCP92_19305 [Nitrospiraceae bacterium]|jgi:hypothetical protein|nr:hypothetical protein [Nitrospiraceae bacterium]
MTNHRIAAESLTLIVLSIFLTALVGCSGGGGGTITPVSVPGTISGSAFKGPLAAATVTAFAINNGVLGGQIGTGQTNGAHEAGNFSISVGGYSGPVMLLVNGGLYTDEATGALESMQLGDVMTCVIPSLSAAAGLSGIQVTPLTSMAQTLAQGMPGGMTSANITAANTAVGNYFMISDILFTQPMDPSLPGSGSGADQDMRSYGMSIAAISQYAKDIGMPFSSGMVTAMMKDASDGRMDGMMMGSPIILGGGLPVGTLMPPNAGTSGLATAMTEFIQNTQLNVSGVTLQDMTSLINQLLTSNGSI